MDIYYLYVHNIHFHPPRNSMRIFLCRWAPLISTPLGFEPWFRQDEPYTLLVSQEAEPVPRLQWLLQRRACDPGHANKIQCSVILRFCRKSLVIPSWGFLSAGLLSWWDINLKCKVACFHLQGEPAWDKNKAIQVESRLDMQRDS